MTKLHVLTAEPLGDGIIKLLEESLQQAREGKISSVAIAMVDRDGCSESAWSYVPSYGLLIGAVARLQHRLIEAGQ